ARSRSPPYSLIWLTAWSWGTVRGGRLEQPVTSVPATAAKADAKRGTRPSTAFYGLSQASQKPPADLVRARRDQLVRARNRARALPSRRCGVWRTGSPLQRTRPASRESSPQTPHTTRQDPSLAATLLPRSSSRLQSSVRQYRKEECTMETKR